MAHLLFVVLCRNVLDMCVGLKCDRSCYYMIFSNVIYVCVYYFFVFCERSIHSLIGPPDLP